MAGATGGGRRVSLRAIIRGIGTAVKTVVQGVQRIMGAVDRWVNGSVNLTVALDILNMDSSFGTTTSFMRSWGPGRGLPVKLPDMRVEVRQTSSLPLNSGFTAIRRCLVEAITRARVPCSSDEIVCRSYSSALVASRLPRNPLPSAKLGGD